MKDIAIYGAGGLGREIACLIRWINQQVPTWNLIGFFDDGKEKGSACEYGKILGGINDLNSWREPLSIAMGIGSPAIVSSIVSKITSLQIDFPNLVSPDILYLDKNYFSMGKGNIICPKCLISCNVYMGDFNLLNGYISLGHDVRIGSFNSLMPSVRISGEVVMGDRNFFGVNSVVLQQIKIGNNTVIGANSLIIRKTKDNMTYIGNPASMVKF